MAADRKKNDSENPEPLDFDRDEKRGFRPSLSPEDVRGDSEDDQDYEEKEAISPEEVKLREDEDDL